MITALALKKIAFILIWTVGPITYNYTGSGTGTVGQAYIVGDPAPYRCAEVFYDRAALDEYLSKHNVPENAIVVDIASGEEYQVSQSEEGKYVEQKVQVYEITYKATLKKKE